MAELKARTAVAPSVSDEPVPEHLCRYVEADWYDPGEPLPPELVGDWDVRDWRLISAHDRWRDARRAWATDHGFDMTAAYGTAPGRDLWAFDRLAAGVPNWWEPPRTLAELNSIYEERGAAIP